MNQIGWEVNTLGCIAQSLRHSADRALHIRIDAVANEGESSAAAWKIVPNSANNTFATARRLRVWNPRIQSVSSWMRHCAIRVMGSLAGGCP